MPGLLSWGSVSLTTQLSLASCNWEWSELHQEGQG